MGPQDPVFVVELEAKEGPEVGDPENYRAEVCAGDSAVVRHLEKLEFAHVL